jgi:hypothetical protein
VRGRGSSPGTRTAADLYRGDLLKGLSVREPGFEEWLVGERCAAARAGPRRDGAAPGPARAMRGRSRRRCKRRSGVVALDPVREPVHRALMRLHMELGRRGEAFAPVPALRERAPARATGRAGRGDEDAVPGAAPATAGGARSGRATRRGGRRAGRISEPSAGGRVAGVRVAPWGPRTRARTAPQRSRDRLDRELRSFVS